MNKHPLVHRLARAGKVDVFESRGKPDLCKQGCPAAKWLIKQAKMQFSTEVAFTYQND